MEITCGEEITDVSRSAIRDDHPSEVDRPIFQVVKMWKDVLRRWFQDGLASRIL